MLTRRAISIFVLSIAMSLMWIKTHASPAPAPAPGKHFLIETEDATSNEGTVSFIKYIRSIVCEASCHLVTWSLGHLVIQSLGHLVTCSLSHSVTWSLGHRVTRSLSHSVTRSLRHSVTQSLGHLVTWSLGHWVILLSLLFQHAH